MKQSEKESERRKLLKQSILSGAAIGATPIAWKSPKVSSVILPAHATTTDMGAQPLSCGTSISTQSVTNDEETDTDIAVIYDCVTQTCQLITGQWEDGEGIPANAVLAIDVDDDSDDGATFDALGSGSNWTPQSSASFEPPESDQSPGSYSFDLTSNVCMTEIRVQFQVAVSSTNSPRTMTLSNVSIEEL
ncbi:MAG: hypothetical protein AAF402_16175 [Pseudomonadota bacterium]